MGGKRIFGGYRHCLSFGLPNGDIITGSPWPLANLFANGREVGALLLASEGRRIGCRTKTTP